MAPQTVGNWSTISEVRRTPKSEPGVEREEEIISAGVPGYRFVPPIDVFSSPNHVKSQQCYCPSGPPCAPEGTFNASLCQYDSPVLLSFPHFYLAEQTLREAVTGISPPEPEKHQLFIDVQPKMGTALRARARIQINLAVSQVRDIKQVASFPDIVFPIMWFEDGIDGLPDEMTSLMKLAVVIPPIAKTVLVTTFGIIGIMVLFGALICLARASHRQKKLHLSNPLPSYSSNKKNDLQTSLQSSSSKNIN